LEKHQPPGDDASPLPNRDVVLVFPAGLPESQAFRRAAAATGHVLIGASSRAFDPEASAYHEWEYLPYVHEPAFGEALERLLSSRGITAVYSPHEVVSGVLAELLPMMAPGVRLLSPSPTLTKQSEYRRRLEQAEEAGHRDWGATQHAQMSLPPLKRAGILRQVDSITGMTDMDKIDAVIALSPSLPKGDVVEIGSWWGRSAALFLLLARHYAIGPVLCVDPWSNDFLDQGVAVLDRASARQSAEQALEIFQINLSPLASGDINYIRQPSAAAASCYGPGLVVTTETFGSTRYSGVIALLHIDGNHAFAQVEADVRLWAPRIRPGGLLILDDYVWAFGDGPKRVGDAFLREHAERIDLAFVMGTALFVRLKSA
jgi:cephalosporin hydroxylase